MDLEAMKEKIAILTPTTLEQLADCRTEEEAVMVGTLTLRGFCSEMIDEILQEHRRLSAQITKDTFCYWNERSESDLFSGRRDVYAATTFEEYKKIKSDLLQQP